MDIKSSVLDTKSRARYTKSSTRGYQSSVLDTKSSTLYTKSNTRGYQSSILDTKSNTLYTSRVLEILIRVSNVLSWALDMLNRVLDIHVERWKKITYVCPTPATEDVSVYLVFPTRKYLKMFASLIVLPYEKVHQKFL